jgi:hypothetical protein
MEEKKKKTSSEAKKKAKSSGKKERKKEGERYEEMKKEEEKKEEIKVQEEPREAVQQEFAQQESEYGKNLLSSIIQKAKEMDIIQKAKDRINSQIQIAKNMYSLFQGMKQAYGGDTKKVLQVAFSFAKEEIKRRAKEKVSELKGKANELREKAKKIVKI